MSEGNADVGAKPNFEHAPKIRLGRSRRVDHNEPSMMRYGIRQLQVRVPSANKVGEGQGS